MISNNTGYSQKVRYKKILFSGHLFIKKICPPVMALVVFGVTVSSRYMLWRLADLRAHIVRQITSEVV